MENILDDVLILNENHLHHDLLFKAIVIGDSAVGKSCLTMKATKNIYEEDSQATVGFEFFSFNMCIKNKIVKLQVWDTCGQEVYRSLITNFYRSTNLAIIVYSIDNKNSLDDLSLWIKELRLYASPNVKIIIIGNKCDLEERRKITKEEGETFANNINADFFFEASAKNDVNTKKIFLESGKLLYKSYLLNEESDLKEKEIIKLPFPLLDKQIEVIEQKNKCCK